MFRPQFNLKSAIVCMTLFPAAIGAAASGLRHFNHAYFFLAGALFGGCVGFAKGHPFLGAYFGLFIWPALVVLLIVLGAVGIVEFD